MRVIIKRDFASKKLAGNGNRTRNIQLVIFVSRTFNTSFRPPSSPHMVRPFQVPSILGRGPQNRHQQAIWMDQDQNVPWVVGANHFVSSPTVVGPPKKIKS